MNLEHFYGRIYDVLADRELDVLYDRRFDEADRLAEKSQLIWDKCMRAACYGA
jgi:hypothetical protein